MPGKSSKGRDIAPGVGAPAAKARSGRSSQVVRIAEHLERAILKGRFRGGQKLSESDLARSLGASRTPVREAMRLLVAQGLLVSRHGSGAAVPRLEPEHVSEVLAIRCCLESFALKLAIPGIGEDGIACLNAAYDAMERARATGDVVAFEEHDEALHRAILEAAGNRALIGVIDGLSKQIRAMRGVLLTLPGEFALSQEFHRALIDAIEARDVERAVRLREGTLEIDEQKLLAELRRSREEDANASPDAGDWLRVKAGT